MLLLNQNSMALIIICDGPELKDGLLIADGTSGLENRRLGGGLAERRDGEMGTGRVRPVTQDRDQQ